MGKTDWKTEAKSLKKELKALKVTPEAEATPALAM